MASDPRELASSLLQFDRDVVLLVVGPAKETFLLHRAHAKCSGFFASAFKKEWERGSRELSLPDDDPRLVRTYLHCLYIASKSANADTSLEVADHADETALLAELYVLGKKLQDSRFKNTIIDAIMAEGNGNTFTEDGRLMRCWLAGLDVDTIYRGTCAGSHGRGLTVDYHVENARKNWIVEEEVLNKEFLVDLCAALLERERGGWGGVAQNCSYHEHRDGEMCSARRTNQQMAMDAW